MIEFWRNEILFHLVRVKKHVRCPGVRKLITAFKKRSNCIVISVDEFFTSQTCARCLECFDVATKKHKFKVCQDCKPKLEAMLPSLIVTQLGKRTLQGFRKMEREELAEEHSNEIGAPVAKSTINSDLLMSKVKHYSKDWRIDNSTGEIVNVKRLHLFEFDDEVGADGVQRQVPHKTLWQRDIVAAKCIMIEGFCTLFNLPIPVTLQRPAGR